MEATHTHISRKPVTVFLSPHAMAVALSKVECAIRNSPWNRYKPSEEVDRYVAEALDVARDCISRGEPVPKMYQGPNRSFKGTEMGSDVFD